MGVKYSIILPYCKRHTIKNTLMSYLKFYANRDDYEVIIIEDKKNIADVEEHDFIINYVQNLNSPCIKIIPANAPQENFNPSLHYNQGVEKSTGTHIILSNPECFHGNDILSGLDEYIDVNPAVYIVCACENVHIKESETGIITQHIGWYQHSVHNNRRLHFTSAISKENFIKIGGFDENYSKGIAWEDDDFRNKILQANIPIIIEDNLLVFHQYHDDYDWGLYRYLWNLNEAYYRSKWG
jgi:hypothetical protein